ncbi:cold shock domain-containing protein [Kitasatospora sp. NPDC089797]|uniref:cold shock domain-containing protein n=1 Tax=Kitasatospora sp. NPDC089797 TaxID=3155298 RepID=UPI00341F830B
MSDAVNETLYMGHVLEWHADQGWGVLASRSLREPVWAHFSAIVGSGYRELTAGQVVHFTAEQAEQDSFHWRAVQVRLPDSSLEPQPEDSRGPGYSSDLTITFDDE